MVRWLVAAVACRPPDRTRTHRAIAERKRFIRASSLFVQLTQNFSIAERPLEQPTPVLVCTPITRKNVSDWLTLHVIIFFWPNGPIAVNGVFRRYRSEVRAVQASLCGREEPRFPANH